MYVTPLDEQQVVNFRDTMEPDVVWTLPRRYRATIDDGSQPWDVEITFCVDPDNFAEGRPSTVPVAESITVRRRPGGEPASAAGFRRLPLGLLSSEALRFALQRWEVTADEGGQMTLVQSVVPRDERGAKPSAKVTKAFTRRERSNQVTPEQRASALALYEQAKASRQKAPLEWVGDQLGVARATAHQWIQDARMERGK